VTYPKIELHVHLEGTVRAHTLLEIARRNDYPLPADTVEGLAELYHFRDFAHFIEVWILTTNALQKADDFRQVVVDYAAEAAAHGAVYVEGIFSPAERVRRGVSWDEVFAGFCDGAAEARELHGLEIALTPDIPRGFTLDEARATVRYALEYGLAARLVEAGVLCSISTDDPAMFDTDLTRDYETARALGLDPRSAFEAGVAGALQEDAFKSRLRDLGDRFDWSANGAGSALT